ncbi:MAG: MFS transporter, partial [Acidobacteriota bacterium]|nr:MFS transporter [Acidobacteriota bacterium]
MRTNISVAQQFMARDLSFSNIQIGYVFSAFLIGYTIFQVPAGLLGDRFGPRIVLTISGVWWGVTTLLTGLLPGFAVKGTALTLGSLLLLRFLHGMGEAGTFPVAMTAVAEWFRPSEHALVNALIFTGSTLGAAFSPPLVAYIMNALGWRETFYFTALPPVVLAAVWWR